MQDEVHFGMALYLPRKPFSSEDDELGDAIIIKTAFEGFSASAAGDTGDDDFHESARLNSISVCLALPFRCSPVWIYVFEIRRKEKEGKKHKGTAIEKTRSSGVWGRERSCTSMYLPGYV